jgi:hypothetical protein
LATTASSVDAAAVQGIKKEASDSSFPVEQQQIETKKRMVTRVGFEPTPEDSRSLPEYSGYLP